MEEIISLDGNLFRIWYESPNERIEAIEEAKSTANMKSLTVAASCPSQLNKAVGNTIIMSSIPTVGTPPYTYSFYKVSPGSTTQTFMLGTSSAGQTLNSYSYPLTSLDIPVGTSKLKLGVIVFDSCPTGSKTSEEWCFVNVAAVCNPPTANLVIV